jgi:hypothetical protein
MIVLGDMTKTREYMMGIVGTTDQEAYLKKIELIAWWYLYAISNNYEITAEKEINPIRKESLDLPFKLGGENNEM